MALTGTTLCSACSSKASATTTSEGRTTSTPALAADARVLRTSPSRSGSIREVPTFSPLAARKVLAIAPPMRMASARRRKLATTPILSDTLAPPRTRTNGRSGDSTSRDRTSTSFCSSSPAAQGSCSATPTTEAWARCTAPKASST